MRHERKATRAARYGLERDSGSELKYTGGKLQTGKHGQVNTIWETRTVGQVRQDVSSKTKLRACECSVTCNICADSDTRGENIYSGLI